MKKRKTIVDREPLSSDYIRGKQDFNSVLKQHSIQQPHMWKSPWFYGPVGVASIALFASIIKLDYQQQTTTHDKTSTLTSESALTTSTPTQLALFEPLKEQVSKIDAKTEVDHLTNVSSVERASNQETQPTIQPEIKDELEHEIEAEPGPEATLEVTESLVESQPKEDVEKPILAEPVEVRSQLKYPSIGGIYNGRVPSKYLISESIRCGEGWDVISFYVNFYDGAQEVVFKVDGNKIPEELARRIVKYNEGHIIFFTNIYAQSSHTGEVKWLPSMDLQPTM